MRETLGILFVMPSEADAEPLLAAMRDAGLDFVHKFADDEMAFGSALSEMEWDAVICHLDGVFGAAQALLEIRKIRYESPIIVLAPVGCEDRAQALMHDGIRDYVTPGVGLRRLPALIMREHREAVDRRQFRQTADRVKARLVDAFESLGEGFALFDDTGRLLQANSRFFQIFRIPRDLAEPGTPVAAIVRSMQSSGIVEDGGLGSWFCVRAPDGEVRPFERQLSDGTRLIVSERRTGDGCTVTVVTDVTALRKTQERLATVQRMESIGHMTGGIAHDFNNLLTAVLVNTDVLCARIPEGPLRDAAKTAHAAARRGSELVRKILTFGRPRVADGRTIDANAVAVDLIGMVRRTLPPNVEIVFRPAAALWPVVAEGSGLEGALLNLIVNAKDAMPKGGTLLVATANVVREKPTDELAPGSYVDIVFSDSGDGMSPEVMRRAREPYFTTKGDSGTGLGLFSVSSFARQAGGNISIESEPGAGTAVTIHLPRAVSKKKTTRPEVQRRAAAK